MRLALRLRNAALIAAAAATLVVVRPAAAQPPTSITIQGRLQGVSGAALTGTRGYRVRFFDAPTTGFQVGTDFTGMVTIGDSGRFAIEIVPPAALTATATPYYELALDSAVPPDGVDSSDVFPERVKINSAPFALLANNSQQLGGQPASAFVSSSSLTLDAAYDGSGAGAGRTITTDSGAVNLAGTGGLTATGRIEGLDTIRVSNTLGGNISAQFAKSADGGRMEAYDENASRAVNIGAATGGAGGVAAFRMANTNNVGVGLVADVMGTNSGGQVFLLNAAQAFTAIMSVSSLGSGLIDVHSGVGANPPVTTMGVNNLNGGYFQITNAAGAARGIFTQDTSGHGAMALLSSTGVQNVFLSGGGTKNFVAVDPENPDRMIRYTCLEGPEVAMYARGKGRIEGGRGTVVFPDHFRKMAVPGSVTVTLTPMSAASRGLATVDVTAAGFEAAELYDGKGSYEFSWVAFGVRAGFETEAVYLDKTEWNRMIRGNMDEVHAEAATQRAAVLRKIEAGATAQETADAE